MTIRNKILFWFLLPSILIAAITVVFCYFYTKKTIERNIFDQLEIVADTLHHDVRIFLTGKRERIIDFGSDGFIRDCTEDIRKRDERIPALTEQLNTHLTINKLHLDPDILTLIVVDLGGKVISSTDSSMLHRDVSAEPYFSETRERSFYTTDIFYSPEAKPASFFDVASILFSKEEQLPVGMIVARYRGDNLGITAHRGITGESRPGKRLEGLGETGESYIVNRDTVMITGSRFRENAVFNQIVNTEGVRAAFRNRKGITGIYPDYRNIPVLGVSRYLEEMDWVIVASKEVSEVFAPVIFLRNFTAVMGTTGVIVIVAIAIALSKTITETLNRITKITRRMASRDLEHPVLEYKNMDDLKGLGKLINAAINNYQSSNMFSVHSAGKENLSFLQLKSSSDEWATIFDASADIFTIHDRSLKVVRANGAFFDKFSINEKQLEGKYCSDVFHCSEYILRNCLLVKCARSLKPESEEINDPNMGGNLLVSTYPLIDEKGLFQGAVRQVKNITEKKKVNEMIKMEKEFNAKLQELDRTKTEFLSIVSHEIRTPLAAILGFARIISNRFDKGIFPHIGAGDGKVLELTRTLKRDLGTIISEGKRLTDLINDLLDITKIEAGKIEWDMKAISVSEIIEQATTITIGSCEQYGIRLIKDVKEGLPDISGDRDRLVQVMINLISNAVKFTEKGSITCRAREINNKVMISVIDTGTGIPQDCQEKIFEKFGQVKNRMKSRPKGTGLGLPICKEIIERHGGTIWVESEPGKGSIFSFIVPCSIESGEDNVVSTYKDGTIQLEKSS